MGGSSEASKVAAIPVPSSSPSSAVFFYAFVLFFVALAIYYLVNSVSMPLPTILASIAWLIIVLLSILLTVSDDGGIKKYLINRLGQFSKRHLVWAISASNKSDQLCFGYVMFDHEFHYLQVPSSAVVSVEWSPGQATSLAGRDRNDWCVAIWFRDPAGPKGLRFPSIRDEDVHMVGRAGRKSDIEPFGRSLVAFLQNAGVDLAPTDSPNEFRVAKGSTAK